MGWSKKKAVCLWCFRNNFKFHTKYCTSRTHPTKLNTSTGSAVFDLYKLLLFDSTLQTNMCSAFEKCNSFLCFFVTTTVWRLQFWEWLQYISVYCSLYCTYITLHLMKCHIPNKKLSLFRYRIRSVLLLGSYLDSFLFMHVFFLNTVIW